MIKAVAASGGVCCINMVGAFVDLSNPDIVTTDMLFRHIDYMAELVGIDHVGFGSDFIPHITWTAEAIQQPMGQVVFPNGGYSAKMGAKGVPTPAPRTRSSQRWSTRCWSTAIPNRIAASSSAATAAACSAKSGSESIPVSPVSWRIDLPLHSPGLAGQNPPRDRKGGSPMTDSLIRNAHVFDGISPDLSDLTSVLVRDGKIAEVGPELRAPDGAR